MEVNPQPKKPTRSEQRRRLDIVESLVIDCASTTEIMRYFADKEGLRFSRRTVQRYIDFAEKRIQRAGEPKKDIEIRKAKRRLERCFARALSGDKKSIMAAIAAQKAINNLLGLNAPKDDQDEMSVEQLTILIASQRKEMQLSNAGPLGIKEEILQLFERYSVIGEDSGSLLEEMTKRIKSKD